MALTTEEKAKIIKEFDKKTGSAQVQIALLTSSISKLTEHLKKNRHDYSALRGLSCLLGKRRAFLNYLKKKDKKTYQDVIEKLKIRDSKNN